MVYVNCYYEVRLDSWNCNQCSILTNILIDLTQGVAETTDPTLGVAETMKPIQLYGKVFVQK